MNVSNRIKKNTVIVAAEIMALLLLVFYALFAFRESRAKIFHISGLPVVSREDGYDYLIENVSRPDIELNYHVDVKGCIITGWAVQKGVRSGGSDMIKVVLKNVDTGTFYSFPTVRQMRKEVTEQFYDGTDYDESGFEAKIQYNKEIDTDTNEYEIYVYLKNKEGKKLINTSVSLNEWIDNIGE